MVSQAYTGRSGRRHLTTRPIGWSRVTGDMASHVLPFVAADRRLGYGTGPDLAMIEEAARVADSVIHDSSQFLITDGLLTPARSDSEAAELSLIPQLRQTV